MTVRERNDVGQRGPKVRRIADYLRREAVRGTYGNGFPSESALAAQYGVSRNVIREALTQLRAEGLIDRRPGRGTSVAHHKVNYRIDELRGLNESFRRTGTGEVVNVVRDVAFIPAPPIVAHRLSLRSGAPVLFIERVRNVDGMPFSLDRTYLTEDAGRSIDGADLTNNDIFALLEDALGSPLGESEYLIEATAADEDTARELEVPASSPLVLMERLTRTAEGAPIDLEFISLRSDRASLSARGSRPKTPGGNTHALDR